MDNLDLFSGSLPAGSQTPSGEDLVDMCNGICHDIDEIRQLFGNLALRLTSHPMPKWLTSYEVQKHFNISKLTLKRYRDEHLVRCINLRGRYRYRYEDFFKIQDH